MDLWWWRVVITIIGVVVITDRGACSDQPEANNFFGTPVGRKSEREWSYLVQVLGVGKVPLIEKEANGHPTYEELGDERRQPGGVSLSERGQATSHHGVVAHCPPHGANDLDGVRGDQYMAYGKLRGSARQRTSQ
ncbi:hypothetical protein EV363DRAFT_1435058 [Boletus edulis]|uniref:Secreted protein n=1 Tax=Boletus edulis BED1 TaxID=1328754 RepID=A0AAD4BWU1_BOLED|nr:hypothetical protein EV363DRAFT_1435058 [Boletus edulis]KAF8441746.1 hypothetical protein L210DRAFT_3630289 [Boletus edulis BED1]